MVQYIDAQKTQVITKNGECLININLTLNINLTNDGINLNVGTASNFSNQTETKSEKPKQLVDDKVNWEVPDFTSLGTINFGK